MRLLILMYHRARVGALGNSVGMLDAHFAYLKQNAVNVLPGERLRHDRLNVCLTFDDGTFDFYAEVYPLLRKYGLRAVLAVPPALLRDTVEALPADRLALDPAVAWAQPSRGGFCTWAELGQMVDSGMVVAAAHGFTHARLDEPGANLPLEIDAAKITLSRRLAKTVDSFVFPYGRYSQSALNRASESYRFVLRIGGAMNTSWNQRLLYRIDADRMKSPAELFGPLHLAKYRMRYLWNRLRRR